MWLIGSKKPKVSFPLSSLTSTNAIMTHPKIKFDLREAWVDHQNGKWGLVVWSKWLLEKETGFVIDRWWDGLALVVNGWILCNVKRSFIDVYLCCCDLLSRYPQFSPQPPSPLGIAAPRQPWVWQACGGRVCTCVYLCPLHGMEKVAVGRGDSVTTPGLHQAVRKESPLIKGKEKLWQTLGGARAGWWYQGYKRQSSHFVDEHMAHGHTLPAPSLSLVCPLLDLLRFNKPLKC